MLDEWHMEQRRARDLEDETGVIECIVAVAIKTLDDVVWVATGPKRHHDVIRLIRDRHRGDFSELQRYIAVGEQGFLTNYGRFLTRWQATRVAVRAEQCPSRIRENSELYSEDIW